MKLRLPCPTCRGRDGQPTGRLWLGGRDYLECPDCEGTMELVLHEERTPAPPTRVFLALPKVA